LIRKRFGTNGVGVAAQALRSIKTPHTTFAGQRRIDALIARKIQFASLSGNCHRRLQTIMRKKHVSNFVGKSVFLLEQL
jgi:hypothetical protein